MALNDRMTYQGSYNSIIRKVSKPEDKPKDKWINRVGTMTVLQKNMLLQASFLSKDFCDDAVSFVKTKLKNSSESIIKTAKGIDEIIHLNKVSKKDVPDYLKKIANLNTDAFIDILDLADKSTKSYVKLDVQGIKWETADPSASVLMSFLEPSFGFMHLERLRYTPLDAEVGELLYTLCLAPGEEVVLSQKTWSKTKKEFTEIVDNIIEKEITTQRTESLEIAESTQSQTEYNANMSTSFQGSGTIGVVKLSGSGSTDMGASMSSSQEKSIKSNMSVTQQATARSKQEHKTTFQVSSESGYEDESQRKIKNPNHTHAVRYDYFRYMRKWKIDLERYGVRLTMDVMARDPGVNLRKEFEERKRLEAIINGADGCDFTIDDIDESSLPEGVGPKPKPYTMTDSGSTNPRISASNEKDHEFNVPAGYEVADVHVNKTGGGGHAEVEPNAAYYRGSRGRVIITVHRGVAAGEDRVSYEVYLDITPTEETILDWQNSVVQAKCREWEAGQQEAKATAQLRLDELEEAQGEKSTLMLRKDEREEVMSKVVELFLPPGTPPHSAPETIVRFIHEAFEWQNMSYSLYPYFWNNVEDAYEIDHPDLLRRDFLRAGYARVLVPVRPNYEERVMAYAYTGNMDELVPLDNMRSVAQEIMDAHSTTYAYERSPEGICTEKFETIATWYEYTPTDAIDMKIHLIDGNIAEPTLETRLKHELKHMDLENKSLDLANQISSEINTRINAIPADQAVLSIENSKGESIDFKAE